MCPKVDKIGALRRKRAIFCARRSKLALTPPSIGTRIEFSSANKTAVGTRIVRARRAPHTQTSVENEIVWLHARTRDFVCDL
jgi:hypothetical protein